MGARYFVHGLHVSSAVMLPDVQARRGASAVDVRVELRPPRPVADEPPPGDVLIDHRVGDHRQYAASASAEGARFRVPGYGDFAFGDQLDHIACTPDPRVPKGYLPIMLTGNVLSFLLGLQGHTVLHAGAVEVAGGAVAVVGPSGAGKSTLTAWLCSAGARLITDDVLRVDSDGTCHRGGRELRLRDRARPLAEQLARSGGEVRRTVDGRHAARFPGTDRAALPLRAVVVPRPHPDTSGLCARRLDAMAAALLLAGVPRTLGWRTPEPAQAHFATLTALAQRISVHVVDVPWGPPFDPATPRRLLDRLDLDLPAPGASADEPRRLPPARGRPAPVAPR